MAELLSEFDRVPNSIAQLTDVDGAVVISRDINIFGFGAKINYDPKNKTLPPINMIDSLDEGMKRLPIPLTDLGGMRHQSAAYFVSEQHGAVALVVSQDGNVSAFLWEDNAESGRRLMPYTRLELLLF
jgi:DNA integrity scanning protein DisA with diadenylate cyclase activity